jgi:hypothetical protein
VLNSRPLNPPLDLLDAGSAAVLGPHLSIEIRAVEQCSAIDTMVDGRGRVVGALTWRRLGGGAEELSLRVGYVLPVASLLVLEVCSSVDGELQPLVVAAPTRSQQLIDGSSEKQQ